MTFLRVAVYLIAFAIAPLAWAEDASLGIEYRTSELGIDYRALAPSPVAEMLSQGEAEWMANVEANKKYGNRQAMYWERGVVATLAKGGLVPEKLIERLKEFAPNMLRNFAWIDGDDPVYGLVATYGSEFLSERVCQAANDGVPCSDKN